MTRVSFAMALMVVMGLTGCEVNYERLFLYEVDLRLAGSKSVQCDINQIAISAQKTNQLVWEFAQQEGMDGCLREYKTLKFDKLDAVTGEGRISLSNDLTTTSFHVQCSYMDEVVICLSDNGGRVVLVTRP